VRDATARVVHSSNLTLGGCGIRELPYDTLRVFLRMKSIRMNCPSVIVFVKYALPRQIADTVFTNSTRLRSRVALARSLAGWFALSRCWRS